MATKAQLEAELIDLRRQLAERPEEQKETQDETHTKVPLDTDSAHTPDEQVNWDKEVSDIMANLEDLPHKQPLLFALGAFAIGYFIGRSK